MASNRSTANQAFSHVFEIEKHLIEIPLTLPHTDKSHTTISDQQLATLGIHRASRLDVDNHGAADAWPVFFQPLDESPTFKNAVEALADELNWSLCPDVLEHTGRLSCALHAIHWFDSVAGDLAEDSRFHPEDQPRWIGIR